MPSLGIAPHPGGCAGPAMMPAQDAAPVSGVFPAGASFHLLEIRVQAIQLLAISRGSRNAPSHTPGHGRYFPGMLLSPSGFPSRSAIRPRNLPSSSSRLSRGYNRAPRGADAAEEDIRLTQRAPTRSVGDGRQLPGARQPCTGSVGQRLLHVDAPVAVLRLALDFDVAEPCIDGLVFGHGLVRAPRRKWAVSA